MPARPSNQPAAGTLRHVGVIKSMFFFFSRRLGCAGSVGVSLGVTVLLLYLLGWL